MAIQVGARRQVPRPIPLDQGNGPPNPPVPPDAAMPAAQLTLLHEIGFWAALIAFVGAVGYLLSALLQMMRVVNDLHDAIIGFSASLLMPLPVLLALLVLHYTVPEHQRFWTHAAVACAIIYTTYNTLNYVVQLATVIPKGYTWSFDNQAGTQGPLTLLNQTPHSLFWDVDALGYIFLSLATLFAAPVFARAGLEGWVRRLFIANAAAIPFFCVVYFWPGYSATQLLFGLPWGFVPCSLLALALYFRREAARLEPGASAAV